VKTAVISISVALSVALFVVFFNEYLAPRLFNSRIERIHEKGLPTACIENGTVLYCRMKADDFRLPLPPGSHAFTPIITTGGFDWVDGTVQIQFGTSNLITPAGYDHWLSGRLPAGASVSAEPIQKGLMIKFHYFGDK
jgi:hypothetical protein